MRFVLALLTAVCVAGVAAADIPRPGARVFAPGGWCGGQMGGRAVTASGVFLARWLRRHRP